MCTITNMALGTVSRVMWPLCRAIVSLWYSLTTRRSRVSYSSTLKEIKDGALRYIVAGRLYSINSKCITLFSTTTYVWCTAVSCRHELIAVMPIRLGWKNVFVKSAMLFAWQVPEAIYKLAIWNFSRVRLWCSTEVNALATPLSRSWKSERD